jgi:hypothetical protein
MKQPAHCKYPPLEAHLRELSAAHATLTLTFEQIESAMQSKLPQSALERPTWWDNEVHGTLSHKNAWLNARLKVAEVNLAEKWVRFVQAG